MAKRSKNKNSTTKNAGGKNTSTVEQKRKKSHRVGLIADSALEYPDLWLQVYLAGEGPVENALLRQLFVRTGCMGVDDPSEADLVVFGGGTDVTPDLYDQPVHHAQTMPWIKRDLADLDLFERCFNEGIPMIGICRGAQFGHVMNGGSLYQHVNNHTGDHSMYVPKDSKIIHRISSSHHQMVRQRAGMTVIGTAPGKSDIRYNTASLMESGKNNDIEAFFYKDSCFFGVQGHPEYRGYAAFAVWFLKAINEYIVENPDITYDKAATAYRLKEEVMDRRSKNCIRDIGKCRELLKNLQAEKEKV